MRNPAKLYRWLLMLYPARFREEYQSSMERQFLDEYRESGNRWSRIQLWQRAIADIVVSAPRQFAGELKLDLTHGIRAYRNRSFSVILAVIALGLTLGATTGVFSVLNALLLRNLPFSKPAQLAELWFPPVSAFSGRAAFTAWYSRSSYLQGAAGFSSSEMNLAGERDALRVKVAETSANFFSLLGMNTAAGRTFTPDEDVLGRNAVAVISYGLWQQLFAGDPEALGKSIQLNGARLTIIGVAPANLDYPGKTSLWIPTIFDFEKIPKRGAFLVQTIGRLKQGIRIQTAKQMFEAEVRRAHPEAFKSMRMDERNRPRLVALQNQLAGPVRQASWALAGLTLLVLLTACANVVQLLLSRVTERQQELALRTALGASRARLTQQLITEATLLTLKGAMIGLIVAQWTSKIASSFVPAQLVTQQYTVADWRVFTFAIAMAVMTGVAFGFTSAWFVERLQPSGSAIRNQPGMPNKQTKKVRAGLIALQSALAFCLVTNSVALSHAFLRLLHVDLGFRTANVVTLNVSLQGTKHTGKGEWQYYSDALSRLRALPGVQAAGAVSYLPLANKIYMANSFKLDSGQTIQRIVTNAVTPGYFHAMGTNFIAGQDFAGSDFQRSQPSVIVNVAFAQATGLGTAIVGRKITAPWSHTSYEIVGVVQTTRFGGPAAPGEPQIFWPTEEDPPPNLTFAARVRGQPEAFLARCRDAVRSIDPQVPIYDVRTLDRRLADALSRPKFYVTAAGFLAFLAVLLAVVGIYGTASYSIAQRRREMGIRMAMGASSQGLRRMMLQESMRPVLIGIMVGIGLSLISGKYLEHFLEAAAQPAFWIYAAAMGFLLFAGLVAAWRATVGMLRIDPADALRAE